MLVNMITVESFRRLTEFDLHTCAQQELRYATCKEIFLTIIGILSAAGAGICVPMLVVLFGKMSNSFILFGIREAYNKQIHSTSMEDLVGFRWLGDKTVEMQSHIDLSQDTHEFAIGMIIIGTIQFVFGLTFVISLSYTAQVQVVKARSAYFRATLYREMDWFDSQSPRIISNDLIKHVSNMYEGLGEKLGTTVYYIVTSVSCLAVAISYGWKLALVILIVFPVTVLLALITTKVGNCLLTQEKRAYLSAENVAEDAILNIRSVTAYQGEKIESKRYRECLESSEQAFVRAGSFYGLMAGFLWFTMYCSYALGFYYGVSLTMEEDNDYNVPVLIVVFFCSQIGIVTSLRLLRYINVMLKARDSANKMFDIIDRMTTSYSESKEGSTLFNSESSVSFSNVNFCYSSNKSAKILRGISFNIASGQIVALVGNPNCGKTTCLQLIHRFYDVQTGTIQVDGTNVQRINLHWLRSRVGFVQQKSVLFGLTIYESICHGLSDIVLSDIIDVCKVVYAHNTIMNLPKQYNTPLNHELGEDLRQRLAVARVLIRKPCILMLDNATSHLKSREEVELIKSVMQYQDQKTIIVVSSRISTMKIVDKILFLKNGVIIEEGTFEELLDEKEEFFDAVRGATALKFMTLKLDEWDENIDEFESISAEKLIKIPNLSSCNQTLLNRITSNEHVHHDTVHISHIVFPFDVTEKPVLTGVQEKELHKFSWIKILKMNSNEWPSLFIGCVAALITGFSLPAYAVLFGECLGAIALKSTKEFELRISFYTQMFLVAGFISGAAMIVQGYVIAVSGSKLTKRLRRAVFDAVLRQEMSWFESDINDLGSLLRILRIDTVNARSASGERLTALIQAACVCVVTASLSIYYNWKLGLSIAICVPFMLMGFVYQNHVDVEHVFHEGRELVITKMIVEEALTNIKIITALNLQNYFLIQHKRVSLQICKRLLKSLWIQGLVYGLVLSLPTFVYAACMFYGSHLLEKREIGYENVFKVSEALILGTIIVGQLVALGPTMVHAKLSATKIMQILKREPLIYGPRTVKESWRSHGNIVFSNVSFVHTTNPCLPSLKNFSLQVKEGQVVGLIGSIGSGQSAPIELLMRYYSPTAGDMKLDGKDITTINLVTLRSQMGLIDGDPMFFHRSIAENIAYGDNSREIKMDEILCAAKEANIHNYVTTLPEGYATILDENLSMTFGQKFRLSLARVLLRDPPILLIENLQVAEDEDAEILVEEAIERSCMGRTCIIVSLFMTPAIRNAQYICMLHNGTVVEEGTHKNLMEARGVYYMMYCKQERLRRITESHLLIKSILEFEDSTS